MGGSVEWERSLVETPGLSAFLSAQVNNNNNNNNNIINQNLNQNQNDAGNEILDQNNGDPPSPPPPIQNDPNPNLDADHNETGPVFEYCEHIRRYRLNLPLNNRHTADCRFTLLRLFNNYTDFSSDYSRVMKKHTLFMSDMADVILSEGGGMISELQEELIREAHSDFDAECTLKLLPRVKRIQSSCNYHIYSIQRLLRNHSEGELPPGTISSAKLEYLRLSAYPVLKDIKKYTDKDIQTIHQHTQMIFPIISDMDSRRQRARTSTLSIKSKSQSQSHRGNDYQEPAASSSQTTSAQSQSAETRRGSNAETTEVEVHDDEPSRSATFSETETGDDDCADADAEEISWRSNRNRNSEELDAHAQNPLVAQSQEELQEHAHLHQQ